MDAAAKLMVDEVNRIRLNENRSYADLATQIGLDPGALYKILNDRSEPYDRTLHKIRLWLEARVDAKRPAKRRVSA